MPKSYDKCVARAKKTRGVHNAYAYCSSILKRSRRKRR